MTQQETISYLKAYLNGDTAIGNIIPLRSVLESALEYLVPSLPSNLDEAAEEYAGVNYDCETETDAFYHHIETEAFKVGASWMAGQGETVTKACVIELNEDKGLHWLQMDGSNLCNALKSFNIGDKVIVQIRKK